MDPGSEQRRSAALARRWIGWLACAAAACGEPAAPGASAGGAPAASELHASSDAGGPQEGRAQEAARARKGKGKAGKQAERAASATPAERGPFAGLQARGLTSADGEQTHDFGAVPAGRTVRHVFAFRWEGAAALLPTRLRSDCGCLKAVMYTQSAEGRPLEHAPGTPLAPQALFVVELELDTEILRGQVRKAATLFSEDPPGVLRMVLTGEVRE